MLFTRTRPPTRRRRWRGGCLGSAPHMGEHELLLDPAIRNWVLIPIVIIMFLMGLLRNNVTKMLRKDTPPKREQIKINNQLMRCRRLRANGHFLPPNAFYARKGFFCDKEKGVLMVKQVPSPLLRLLLRPSTSAAAAASSAATTTSAAASRAVALHRRPHPSCPQPADEHSRPHAWRPATLHAMLRFPASRPRPVSLGSCRLPSPPTATPLAHPHQAAPDPMAMMNDPSVMMNMMQGNFAMMVPQMVMMGALG